MTLCKMDLAQRTYKKPAHCALRDQYLSFLIFSYLLGINLSKTKKIITERYYVV